MIGNNKIVEAATLSYSPLASEGLSLFSKEGDGLSQEQQAILEKNGFVICRDRSYPNFVDGYASLFEADLPVFISADSLLHALHWSFSSILAALEREILEPSLRSMLTCLTSRLASGKAAQWDSCEGVDLYLTVAMRLCLGELPGPEEPDPAEEICQVTGLTIKRPGKKKTKALFSQNNESVDTLLSKIYEAKGIEKLFLLGSARPFDFSLFTPRGAYEEEEKPSLYFRLVRWLRSADFRFCSLDERGDWILSRSALYSAFALRELFDQQARDDWQAFAGLLASLLGPFDGMALTTLDALYEWLGSPTRETLDTLEDQALLQKLLDFPVGRQKILEVPIVAPIAKRTKLTPLPLSFSLVGGIYSPDSLAMSSLVFNQVGGGEILRMMPNPLDVAFTVFQNDQAAHFLEAELTQYGYEKDLRMVRDRVSQDTSDTLRGLWLRALQSLSPSEDQESLPEVATTEAFGRRLLQTQLASWAELRRDTILYEKQSRTFGVICSFPDAYVEPNPAFFEALEAYARRGRSLFPQGHPKSLEQISAYFGSLLEVAGKLKEIALQQQRGERLSPPQLQFINQMLFLHEPEMCRPRKADGWFVSLYCSQTDWSLAGPTIADIHTQDTDEQGNSVGKVLHIATGAPRLLVLAVDGPRAFFGLSSSYFEVITEGYQRLNDHTWGAMLYQTIQRPPTWLQTISIGEQLISDEEQDRQSSRAKLLASLIRRTFVVSEEGTFIAELLAENLVGLRAEQELVSQKTQTLLLKATRKITPVVAARIVEEKLVVSYSISRILRGCFFVEESNGVPSEVTEELLHQLAAQVGRKVFFWM